MSTSTTDTLISNFRERSDAERAQQALRAAGIERTLRAPGDELPNLRITSLAVGTRCELSNKAGKP